jgi:hypothetical protein
MDFFGAAEQQQPGSGAAFVQLQPVIPDSQ